MTNKEKALEIAESISKHMYYYTAPKELTEYAAKIMAEWKDKQFEQQKKEFLNKACEWLESRESWDFHYDKPKKTFDEEDIELFRKYIEE